MAKITYDLALTGTTDIEVSAQAETKEVDLVITRDNFKDQPLKIRMTYLQAERFWHALKGCVDFAVKPRK